MLGVEIRIKDKFNKSKSLEVIKNKLYDKVFPYLVDIDFFKTEFYTNGFKLTIIQDAVESFDIIEYFTDRFKKAFPRNSPSNFFFVKYNRGSKVSYIEFYYTYNLLEMAKFRSSLKYIQECQKWNKMKNNV